MPRRIRARNHSWADFLLECKHSNWVGKSSSCKRITNIACFYCLASSSILANSMPCSLSSTHTICTYTHLAEIPLFQMIDYRLSHLHLPNGELFPFPHSFSIFIIFRFILRCARVCMSFTIIIRKPELQSLLCFMNEAWLMTSCTK